MRVMFLGSPAYVIEPLKRLLAAGPAVQVVGVVSQPARPIGRSRSQLFDPPVAAFAKQAGLPVLQPEKINQPESLAAMRAWEPDVAVTAAYGQILSQSFLDIPRRATINIHPSLLPQYRGATPIPSALLAGDTVSGVTILFTVRKLDAGAIIVQEKTGIRPEETAADLYDRFFALGADLLAPALARLSDPGFAGSPQDEAAVTHCRKINKEDGIVDWEEPAAVLHARFKAYFPWPGVFTRFAGRRVQVMDCRPEASGWNLPPGGFSLDKASGDLLVGCGDGVLRVRRLKVEGKQEASSRDFWNGLKDKGPGAVFG